MTRATIDFARFDELKQVKLEYGEHERYSNKMSVLEAVSYVAHEPWSDAPACVCPVIAEFIREWSNRFVDEGDVRHKFLLPIIPDLIGSDAGMTVANRRRELALDWLLYANVPVWLRAAGMEKDAALFAAAFGKGAPAEESPIAKSIQFLLNELRSVHSDYYSPYDMIEARTVGAHAATEAALAVTRGISKNARKLCDTLIDEQAGLLATSAIALELYEGHDLKATVTEVQWSAMELIHQMLRVSA